MGSQRTYITTYERIDLCFKKKTRTPGEARVFFRNLGLRSIDIIPNNETGWCRTDVLSGIINYIVENIEDFSQSLPHRISVERPKENVFRIMDTFDHIRIDVWNYKLSSTITIDVCIDDSSTITLNSKNYNTYKLIVDNILFNTLEIILYNEYRRLY